MRRGLRLGEEKHGRCRKPRGPRSRRTGALRRAAAWRQAPTAGRGRRACQMAISTALRLLTALTACAVLVFVVWLAWVGYLFFARGGPSGLALDPDRRCSSLGFSCGIVTNVLASGVLVALASSFVSGGFSGCSGAIGQGAGRIARAGTDRGSDHRQGCRPRRLVQGSDGGPARPRDPAAYDRRRRRHREDGRPGQADRITGREARDSGADPACGTPRPTLTSRRWPATVSSTR